MLGGITINQQEIELSKGINFILMDNGKGKTFNANRLNDELESQTVLINESNMTSFFTTNTNNAISKEFLYQLKSFIENEIDVHMKSVLIFDGIFSSLDFETISKTIKILQTNKYDVICFESLSIENMIDLSNTNIIRIKD